VAADVINPTKEKKTTNIFHFTFTCPTVIHKKVIPYSYEEAMKMMDGRRHMKKNLPLDACD